MRLHPVISVMLAAWFGLGSTLGPRFLCSCADGTVTVELGHRFCCDTDDSCCDSRDADEESGEPALDTWACADGCESALLAADAVTTFDRAGEELRSSPTFTASAFHQLFETYFVSSHRGARGKAQIPGCCATGTSRLRSVILLV